MSPSAQAILEQIKALPSDEQREVKVTQCVLPVPTLAARTAGTGCVTFRARKSNALAVQNFHR